ncbi:hypothetical protein H1C71_021714, partial [Ictidomys tridecemlineatus]
QEYSQKWPPKPQRGFISRTPFSVLPWFVDTANVGNVSQGVVVIPPCLSVSFHFVWCMGKEGNGPLQHFLPTSSLCPSTIWLYIGFPSGAFRNCHVRAFYLDLF